MEQMKKENEVVEMNENEVILTNEPAAEGAAFTAVPTESDACNHAESKTVEQSAVNYELPTDTDLLVQIRDALIKQNAQEKAKRLYQKLTFYVLVAFVVIIASAVLYLKKPVDQAILALETATKILNEADINTTLASVQTFADTGTATFASAQESITESVKIIESLDIETLNTAISELEGATAGLNSIDFVKLNNAVVKLETAVNQLGKVDFSLLNTAITNLNDAVSPLAKLFSLGKRG